MVTLNNGEIGIVIQRTSDNTAPKVLAICAPFRETPPQPKLRDTRILTFKITDATKLEWERHINVDALWNSSDKETRYSSLFRFQ